MCSNFIRKSRFTKPELEGHMEYMKRLDRIYKEVILPNVQKHECYPSATQRQGIEFFDDFGMFRIMDGSRDNKDRYPTELFRYDQVASYEPYYEEAEPEEKAEAKQTKSINQKIQKHKENISKVKAKVNKIVKEVNEKCTNINNFISAGPEWVEKQATIIEQKSIGEIDKVLDASIGKILKDKKEFIQNLSDGIARRTADQINKLQKKITKEKLDKIVRAKQKLVNKAKAKIGSALLNLMAKLGL